MRKEKSKGKIKEIILKHIVNNKKEYLSACMIFLIGIILGVLFLNYMQEVEQTEVKNYIQNFIQTLKEGNTTIDQEALLKSSIKSNVIMGIFLWFMGSTVIGMPIVYLYIAYRGFCISYAISAAIAVLGTGKGMLFSVSSILLQNIMIIPIFLALSVSGMNLYHSIMKDKRKENIKVEIIRHTIFSLIGIMVLILAAFIEVYGSSNILMAAVKYL